MQRIVLEGDAGLRFAPAPSTGLVRHMRSIRATNVDRPDRAAADRRLGGDPPNAIYLRSMPEGGLVGELSAASDRQSLLLGGLLAVALS